MVLAGMVEADPACSIGTRQHLQTCLRCQADVAGYRRLRRDMRELEVASLSPDDELLEQVLRQVRPDADVRHLHRRGRRLLHFGRRVGGHVVERPWRDRRMVGVTAGVAGAVAGGAVLVSRAFVRSATT